MNSELLKVAEEAYYLQSGMVRFLLEENLALKTYLHEQKLLDPVKYKEHQAKAAELLAEKVKVHMKEWFKTYPQKAELMEVLALKKETPPADPLTTP